MGLKGDIPETTVVWKASELSDHGLCMSMNYQSNNFKSHVLVCIVSCSVMLNISLYKDTNNLALLLSIVMQSLRKHAYSNIPKIWSPKNEHFQIKNFWYFSHFCSKHILWYLLEPLRRGGSNEYPQSMLLSRNKKNNVYPCKSQFYYIKAGFKGVKII